MLWQQMSQDITLPHLQTQIGKEEGSLAQVASVAQWFLSVFVTRHMLIASLYNQDRRDKKRTGRELRGDEESCR